MWDPHPSTFIILFLRVFGANWQLYVACCYNGGWSLERSLPLARIMLPTVAQLLQNPHSAH